VILMAEIPRIELEFYDGLNRNPFQETILTVQTSFTNSQFFLNASLLRSLLFQGPHYSSSRFKMPGFRCRCHSGRDRRARIRTEILGVR